jgi:hypothetical protein
MKSLIVRVAAVALVCLALPKPAEAQFMSGFTGNSGLLTSPNPSDQGTISYAVFQNSVTGTNGTFATFLSSASGTALSGALSSSVKTSLESQAYIYIYQVSIPTSGSTPPDKLYLANPALYTTASIGFANQVVFSGVNGSSALTSSSPTFATDSNAQTITSFNQNDQFHGTGTPPAALSYTFNSVPNTSYYTSIMIAGSAIGPSGSGVGQIGDGLYVQGSVPVPGPEPSTVALLALAFPLFGFGYVRRLRNRLQVPATAAVA